LENFKELSTDNKKENLQWRHSIKTEERMSLTLRLDHIPYNFHRHQKNETHPKRQLRIFLPNFLNAHVVAEKSLPWASRPQAVERRLMLIDKYHVVSLLAVP
jgi:hypothetical protein